MGNQVSFCGESPHFNADTLPSDCFEDANLCTIETVVDPLQRFLSSPNNLKIKTLN
jgi:hypothetical protein